jgi:crotonobetainyl-CoA:carnitine CoA-transferase CaiB-like acyl-CoA transferase
MFRINGAEVTLLEPPEGTRTRTMGPFAQSRANAPVSCLHAHLNGGKQSSVAGSSQARMLLVEAEVVIVDDARLALLADDLRANAVLCEITPFGREGVLAGWRGDELIYQALSGTMFENGSPGRAPLYGVGHRASCAAGVIGYLQAVALLRQRATVRRVVDVSIAEVAASMSFNRATQYSYNATIEGRDARAIPRAIVRCKDGWAAIFIYDHRWRESCEALGLPELIDDDRFTTEDLRLAHWDEFVGVLESRLGTRAVDDVVTAGQLSKVIVAKSMQPSELARDPQLLAREFWSWSSEDDPLPRLGPMFRFSDTPQRDRGPAPSSVGGAPRTRRRRATPEAVGGPGSRPLDGVCVLDLTTAWSGPMATRILAALGAEILKVEGPGRIDDWRGPVRGGLPSRYPDCDPGSEPFNRCYQFNTQNHDKLALALDLKTGRGRELVLGLAAQADVMVANFSAGTLDRMGIGWPVVSELNPRLVLAEMPAYGSGGPMGSYVALGPSMELMCGMAALIGYGDGRPTTTGPAYLDPIGGFNAAAAIVTALAARDRTGAGQQVEIAQREAAMHWIGEEIIFSVATGIDHAPKGNARTGYLVHDAFPCAGEDEWIAIAIEGDGELAALAQTLGIDSQTAAGKLIAEATRAHDKHLLARALQERGVRAAPVCNAWDLAGSAFLHERGLLQMMTHPAAGTHTYQGLPLHVHGLDLRMGTTAPLFGEHTGEVLAERLGLDPAQIASLRSDAIIGDIPRGAVPALREIAR